jgi:2-iminobutanoate/2-iminopropanoate deaminase
LSAIGPYSPVVRAGSWIICSGQLGVREGRLVEGGVREQAKQALANVAALLAGEGCSLAQVVKTTVFLTDMADYAVMNEAYLETFGAAGATMPARSAVAVAGLPLGALIEIEAWARLGD